MLSKRPSPSPRLSGEADVVVDSCESIHITEFFPPLNKKCDLIKGGKTKLLRDFHLSDFQDVT